MREKEKIEKAIYIIQLKIAKERKENKTSQYEEFKSKIENLQKEKEMIYEGNIEIIDKVLSEYLNEVI